MRLLICLLFGLLTPLLAQQAGPSIRVRESVLVSRGLESRPLTEPHLVAHPIDPNHLLGATIVSSATAAWSADQYRAAFLSRDGGRTWTRHDFAVLECGDPWVGITAQGTAVFTVLARHRSLPDTNSQLLVFLSTDGGRTWNQTPQSLGRGHDHQTVAADAEGRIYILSGQGWRDAANTLLWSVFVASAGRREPGGRPWIRLDRRARRLHSTVSRRLLHGVAGRWPELPASDTVVVGALLSGLDAERAGVRPVAQGRRLLGVGGGSRRPVPCVLGRRAQQHVPDLDRAGDDYTMTRA